MARLLGDLLLSPPSEASSTSHCPPPSHPPLFFIGLAGSETTVLMDRPRGPCSFHPMESQVLDCEDPLCLLCCHALTVLNFTWCLRAWKTVKSKKSPHPLYLRNDLLAKNHPSSYTMIKWGLSQECKDSSIYANQSMWYTILTNWRIKTIW